MSGPVIIDLDLATAQPPDGDRPRQRRPWHPRSRRLAGSIAAAVLLGATMTAAVPPAPPLTLAFTVPAGDSTMLDGTTLYVYQHHGDPALTAYRLSDGATKWKAAAGSGGTAPVILHLQIHDGVPLATTLDVQDPSSTDRETTTAYDPETGEQRWSRAGILAAGRPGMVVLMRPPPGQDPADGGPETMPVAVDLVSGEEVWTGPQAVRWAVDWRRVESRSQLVGVDREGVMTSYDLATGVPLATATMTLPGSDHPYDRVEELHQSLLYLIGDLVVRQSMRSDELHAYDAQTLAHRWRAAVPPQTSMAADCGRVVCFAGGTLATVDAASGEIVWSMDPGSELLSQGFWHPYLHRHGSEPLLVNGWLVDAATGERLQSVAPWEPLSDTRERSTEPRILLRRLHQGGSEAEDRTWLARLHGDPLGVQVLGEVPGRRHSCAATDRYLVCRDRDELHVWRPR